MSGDLPEIETVRIELQQMGLGSGGSGPRLFDAIREAGESVRCLAGCRGGGWYTEAIRWLVQEMRDGRTTRMERGIDCPGKFEVGRSRSMDCGNWIRVKIDATYKDSSAADLDVLP